MVANIASANRNNDGFSARVDGTEARRQLRMSVGVVIMLAIGIVSAAATVGAHPIAVKRDVASVVPVTTLHAETNVVGAKAI